MSIQGISQFNPPNVVAMNMQVPQAPAVQPQRSPWEAMLPNLLQSLVSSSVMGLINNKLEENKKQTAMQDILAQKGYTPATEGTEGAVKMAGGWFVPPKTTTRELGDGQMGVFQGDLLTHMFPKKEPTMEVPTAWGTAKIAPDKAAELSFQNQKNEEDRKQRQEHFTQQMLLNDATVDPATGTLVPPKFETNVVTDPESGDRVLVYGAGRHKVAHTLGTKPGEPTLKPLNEELGLYWASDGKTGHLVDTKKDPHALKGMLTWEDTVNAIHKNSLDTDEATGKLIKLQTIRKNNPEMSPFDAYVYAVNPNVVPDTKQQPSPAVAPTDSTKRTPFVPPAELAPNQTLNGKPIQATGLSQDGKFIRVIFKDGTRMDFPNPNK